MFKILRTLAAGAALLVAAGSASAQPYGRPDLARYDARTAPTLAQRLVLCDLASYFATGPDFDAQRLYLKRDNFRFELSTPTAITRGGGWHDEDQERAYFRYRDSGQVTSDEVHALRDQYGLEMERAFANARVGERRFFQDQGRFCRDLARASWRQAAWR